MKKFFTLEKLLLIGVLLLATFLRFWNLNHVPPSASMDEASIAYNAYSVVKTGGDEFGQFPLVSQRGYDDYRRSTYLFLTIPPIAIFGLQVTAERLPAVILSILTVWATYHIVLLLFSKKTPFAIGIALTTTLLLAISPWHVYISRLGHESNAGLSFMVFGVLFFLQGLRTKWKLFLSSFFFILSMISYYSGQIFIPLLALGLIILFRKELFTAISSSKKMIGGTMLLGVVLIPVMWSIFNPAALIRFQGTSTFSPDTHPELFHQRVLLWNKAVQQHNIFGMIVYDRHLFPLEVFWDGYIAHFNPVWLFTNSSLDSFKAPNSGLLYPWEVPFILIGIGALLFTKQIDTKKKAMMFVWFVIAPIPAAVATQAPHAMRAYNFLPTWQLFTALGIGYVVYRLKSLRLFLFAGITLCIIIGLINFCHNYFVVFPKEESNSFDYALSKVIPYVLSQQQNYQKIVFSNTNNLYQSYMVFLYYSHFDPALYQKLGGTKSGGFAKTHAFGKYEFRPIDWTKDSLATNTLFIGNINDFPTLPGKMFANLDTKPVIEVISR